MHLPPLTQFHRLPRFVGDYLRYRRLATQQNTRLPVLKDWNPRMEEATPDTPFDAQYLYHCSWAARQLAERKPTRHVDISSSLWFVGIASAICPIDHYDYRPPELGLPNVSVGACDLVKLPFADGSLQSLSCMHVVEHVGLGRYGDELDASGDRKAMAELQRVLAPGGTLLFVTPAGRPRIVFNSHRIYAYEEITAQFAGLKIDNFALITDGRNGRKFIDNADPALVAQQKYGCGCWAFVRPT